MQKAVPVGVGAMAALIGIELEEARAIAAEASSAARKAAVNSRSVAVEPVTGPINYDPRYGWQR